MIISFEQNVLELQRYLREISRQNNQIPLVVPDGFFGTKTTNAVKAFQKEHFLPETGIVNKITWDHIVSIYEDVLLYNSKHQSIKPIKDSTVEIKPGDDGDAVVFLQVMLNAIEKDWDNILGVTVTGVMDDNTVTVIKSLQECSNLKPTGVVDKKTWNMIATHYNQR